MEKKIEIDEVLFDNIEWPFIKFFNDRAHESCLLLDEPSIQRFHDYHESTPDITIVIPVFGRPHHLARSAECLFNQIQEAHSRNSKKVLLVVCEMSDKPDHEKICINNGIEYVHLRSDCFNKSFAMNFAAQNFPAETFIFYDVDLLTNQGWLDRCIQTIDDLNKQGNSWICQPIEERKIYYISPNNTHMIFSGDKRINDYDLSDHHVQESWYDGRYPPGGVVMVSANLFYAVQGYDPALFWGYSPEDAMFLKRCLRYSDDGRLHFWDTDTSLNSEVFHMFHEPSEFSNISHQYQAFISDILEKNEPMMQWYGQEKHRWKYLSIIPMTPTFHEKEVRFTDDIVNKISELYSSIQASDFTSHAIKWLSETYPHLKEKNFALYKLHTEYIDFINDRGPFFYNKIYSSTEKVDQSKSRNND